MKFLVAYGSKRGGTEGLAAMVGGALRARGVDADVVAARKAGAVDGYDGVIVGGALYASHWHRDARRFVRRHRKELSTSPVWLFSSGPLDDSAPRIEIEPVKQVRQAMDAVGARGHVTFGGRLSPDAKGFPASAMAKNRAGDWRDPEHVTRWVVSLVDELERAGAAPG
jgi:menaquinone-dependent protoporphyrinogen oxidase